MYSSTSTSTYDILKKVRVLSTLESTHEYEYFEYDYFWTHLCFTESLTGLMGSLSEKLQEKAGWWTL